MKQGKIFFLIPFSFFIMCFFSGCLWMFSAVFAIDTELPVVGDVLIENQSSYKLKARMACYDTDKILNDYSELEIEESEKKNIYLRYFSRSDTCKSGIVSFRFIISIDDKEVYAACGWPESNVNSDSERTFNKFGLCYIFHPVRDFPIYYTEINGKKENLKGILKATVTDREDGGINVEWSAKTSSLDS